MIPHHWPVLGVCGYSGSGKTTLIETLIPLLCNRGLAVAVIKHDAHGLTIDVPGKDTDRLFQAGATVLAHDPEQSFVRRAAKANEPLFSTLQSLLADHDLVLVEGHKQTPLPAKVWLESAHRENVPTDCGPFRMILERDADRVDRVFRLLDTWLPEQLELRPLRAGLLIGGASRRMGQPKQLMAFRGRTWAEWVAEALLENTDDLCLLGNGEVASALSHHPRLPDLPGLGGPLAGMMSALRWDPEAAWLFVACDMPLLTPEAVKWVLDQRRPGCWAVIPRQPGGGRAEPLGAWYDPRMEQVLSGCDRPRAVVEHPRVVVPEIPAEHGAGWRNFNWPEADSMTSG